MKSALAEAYRTLRTNVQFAGLDRPAKTLVITSPGPWEGKSNTAANLAVAFAQDGKEVILVDADLRRPQQQKIWRLNGAKGLTSVLLQTDVPDGVIQSTVIKGLRVITTGPVPPNPAELLGSERMKSFIRAVRDMADLVIFDTSPLIAVTDPALLAAQADGVLLVVASEQTTIEAARQAKEMLAKVQARLLGVVVNKVRAKGGSYYY